MNCSQFRCGIVALMTAVLVPFAPARAAEEPDLIFKRSTVFKWLTPNDKLATYGLDDPEVEGVACHFTVPEKGGFKGWIGVAEEVSDISLACRQIGPIRFKAKFEQGEDVFRKRRSLFFKKDADRMTYRVAGTSFVSDRAARGLYEEDGAWRGTGTTFEQLDIHP